MAPVRIRYRIVLPFAALFLLTYGALSAYAILQVAASVETSIARQLRPLGRMVASGPLTPRSFDYVKTAWNTETVIELGGSLDRDLSTLPVERVDGPLRAAAFVDDVSHVALTDGTSYLVVRTPARESARIFLFYPGAILSDEKLRAVGPLVLLSSLGVLAVAGLGFLTARSLARPLESLSSQAARIKDLPSPLAPPSGSLEIRRLADALNAMLADLKAAQAQALEAEKGRLMKELAAGVAHEIKNPLQAIKLLIQIQASLPGEDKRMLLNEIVRIELASLELLSLEAPSRLKSERVPLGRVVDETLDLLGRQLEHLNVRVSRRLQDVPDVDGDPDRLKRVVMNLILNGAQAMPRGGELRVDLKPADGAVRFSVTDGGEGIPESVRGRLFDPFFTTKGDGVGLGLFVTRRIVEAHRGRIGFESRPGQTTFYFELPCLPSS
jgi:signal transduction histidine kinase